MKEYDLRIDLISKSDGSGGLVIDGWVQDTDWEVIEAESLDEAAELSINFTKNYPRSGMSYMQGAVVMTPRGEPLRMLQVA